MKYTKYIFNILILTTILFASCEPSQKITSSVSEIMIDKGWQYKKAEDTSWSNATVPGNIHTDNNGLAKQIGSIKQLLTLPRIRFKNKISIFFLKA